MKYEISILLSKEDTLLKSVEKGKLINNYLDKNIIINKTLEECYEN